MSFLYCKPDVTIGDFVTVNIYSGLGHDSNIGSGCTISGSCDVTGNCTHGEGVFLGGKAATVTAQCVIMANTTVESGKVVKCDDLPTSQELLEANGFSFEVGV